MLQGCSLYYLIFHSKSKLVDHSDDHLLKLHFVDLSILLNEFVSLKNLVSVALA